MYDVENESNLVAFICNGKYWKLCIMSKYRRLMEQGMVHTHI